MVYLEFISSWVKGLLLPNAFKKVSLVICNKNVPVGKTLEKVRSESALLCTSESSAIFPKICYSDTTSIR